jgi:1,4-dihydroxy-2-naphthoate octaprenyltransferase
VATVEGVAPPRGWRVWWEAARPRTLPAALAPIAVGTATAHAAGQGRPGVAALALATALALQIAANLANDVFDYERGADGEDRLGPPRATQQGWVRPESMRRAAVGCLAVAVCLGLGLVWRGGWPIALAGIASLVAALAYTGGPWPLGYHGLGDLTVFIFFGLVGVVGSHYVQALSPSSAAFAAAIPVGLLATAILAVNNLRDIDADRRAGKHTLAVRMGPLWTRRYYMALVAGAPVSVVAAVATETLSPGALLSLALVPALIGLARAGRHLANAELNALLAATARYGTLFCLALAVGVAA